MLVVMIMVSRVDALCGVTVCAGVERQREGHGGFFLLTCSEKKASTHTAPDGQRAEKNVRYARPNRDAAPARRAPELDIRNSQSLNIAREPMRECVVCMRAGRLVPRRARKKTGDVSDL